MTRPTRILARLLVALTCVAASAAQLAAGDVRTFGRAGPWQVTGQQGQCQIGRSLDNGQMQFALTDQGTVITLQSLGWTTMRQPRSNTFKVTLSFDNKTYLRTDALVIARARAFQVFLLDASNPKRQRDFWQRLAQSREFSVAVVFQSGRLRYSLSGIGQAYPIFPKCARRYLKGVALPF